MENVGEDVHGNNGKSCDVKDGNCLGMGNGHQQLKNQEDDQDERDALTNNRPTYGQVVARMPVEKTATHYNMGHKHRGKAIILNHEVFEVANLKSRAGTDQDCKNLESTLKNLGFDVIVYQDLKYKQLDEKMDAIAKMDHTNNDCLCVCVLTHGDTGILYARDTPYKPENLFERFAGNHCPTLAGKPKIFFLQACQGDRLDSGVILVPSSRTETDGQHVHSYKIPSQADFLIVYSTAGGFFAWRNTTRGSWFIQALCEELRKRAYELDLMTILTFVSQKVAIEYESNTPDTPSMHQQKQIPCVLSRLTRLIQFRYNNNIVG